MTDSAPQGSAHEPALTRAQRKKLGQQLNLELIGRTHGQQTVNIARARVIRTQGEWYRWDRHRWVHTDDEELESIIQQITRGLLGAGISARPIGDIRRTLVTDATLPEHHALISDTSGHDGDPRRVGSRSLLTGAPLQGNSFSNGRIIVDADDRVRWKEGSDKTEYWHASTTIAYDTTWRWTGDLAQIWADLARQVPLFAQFLDEITAYESTAGPSPTPAERLKILILQMVGQYILGINPHHKFWILYGASGTGKSTLIKILDLLLGVGGIYHTDIAGVVDEKTAVGEIIRTRAVAIAEIGENPGGANSPREQALTLIKRITGHDILQQRAMYRADTPARAGTWNVSLTTNDIPKFSTSQGSLDALKRRALIIPLTRKIEKPNIHFLGLLADEPAQLATLAAIAVTVATTPPYSILADQYARTPQAQHLLDQLTEYPHQEALALAHLAPHSYITVIEAQAVLTAIEGHDYTPKQASTIYRTHYDLGPPPTDTSHRIRTAHIGHHTPGQYPVRIIAGIAWHPDHETTIAEIMAAAVPHTLPTTAGPADPTGTIAGRQNAR